MAITFKVDSTTAEGTFNRVLRDGHRFYERDLEKFGGAALHDADLARLKATIQSRYDGPRR
jgi:hypothetical protein